MIYKDTWLWPNILVDSVDREEIATLYSFSHYDGPATGLIQWRGEYWYADRFSLEDYRYWIIRLTPVQQQYALNHGLEHSRAWGNSTTYNANGSRLPPMPGMYSKVPAEVDQALWSTYLAEHKSPTPSEDAEVVGYFCHWRS